MLKNEFSVPRAETAESVGVSSAAIAATLITVPTAAGAAEAMISYSDGYATATATSPSVTLQ